MSQSLAHLIKNKIFQGNTTTVPAGDEKKTKNRRWGYKKEGTEASCDRSPLKQVEAGLQFPMSPLNSIGEESRSIGSVSEADGVSESEGEAVMEEHSEGEESTSESPESKNDSDKRRGKLHMLRSKMSIPDLSFKPNKLHHHQPKQHRRQRSGERSPTLSQEDSPHSVPVSPGSAGRDALPLQRPSYERSASGLGSIYKLGSNSSTSSSRFFYSPRRSGNNAANLSSNSNIQNSVVSSKASSGSNLFNTSSSTQQLIRGHARNSSVEMKSVKPQPIPVGRRRSKTLDTYGERDHKKGWDNTSDLLNSINAHLSSSRSNSVKSRSPSLKAQDPAAGTSTAAVTISHNPSSPVPAPLRFSNGSGTIPFPSAPVQPQQPTMSRRGSSIANAFTSFVNLRSFSNSSSKGTSTASVSKVELPGEELPPPPEPEAEESYMDYLSRLSPYGKAIGVILCENDDPFKRGCLSYFLMNYFDFRQLPLDIALRIMLMFLELPKEAQQIDRLLIEFSKIYYKIQCENEAAGAVWVDESQVYFVTFSLLILHTDYFNLKNRFKMTKHEFANLILEDNDSHGCKIPREMLSYFYDNITAKEFTKFEFVPNVAIQSFDVVEQENGDSGDNKGVKFYSPLDIIKTQSSPSGPDFIPFASTTHTGRASSNSFSSYLPHVPVSTSSSNISLVQDDVDIYGHIFDNTLPTLSMAPLVQKNWDDDYMHGIFADENKYNKYVTILKEAKGGYLKLNRQDFHKLAFPVYEILNISERGVEDLYLKIIQMGEIDELTLNRKFTIVGATNKTMWKKQLGILTTCGLIMFDNQDWVNPRLIKDESTGTSNYIIDYNSSASMTVESPMPVRGLLAVNKSHKLLRQALGRAETIEDENESRTSSLSNVAHVDEQCKETNDDCIMRLYGSNKAKVWKCSSQYEKENWIDAINLMAAYDGCFISSNTIENTVVSARKHSIKERVKKLILTRLEKQRKLEESENLLGIYAQTMPICTRTKNELSFHIKQLAVAMEWLVYEIRRSEINSKIIEQVGTPYSGKPDQNGGHQEEDNGDRNNKQGNQAETRQHEQKSDPESVGATPTNNPFVFDERLMHRNFVKGKSAIYDQTEVNKGGILATY